MIKVSNDDDFYSLRNTIERLLNMQCASYKEDYIKRRILSRMNATKTQNYKEYQQVLLGNKTEMELLRNALTINVTKFFRDPEIFDTLKKEILPEILRGKNRIRIWSAGCSSGEEPYSLAILLAEYKSTHRDLDALIYASDIDEEILKKARDGIYEKQALENVSDVYLKRYFAEREDTKFEVKSLLKPFIRFQSHDLMRGIPVARFLDLVLCRNVTIYFNEKQKNLLVTTINEGLAPGGFYIMGMSEYLGREVESLFKPYRPMHKIFVKP